MKIGLLANADSVHTQKIANGLAGLGHEVYLYSLPEHMTGELLYTASVQLIVMPFKGKAGYFLNSFHLKKRLKVDQIEVLNSHYASGYGTLSSMVKFRPTAISVWGSDIYLFANEGWLKKSLIKHNLKSADLLLATSNALADATMNLSPTSKIIVTPFGVDTDLFMPVAKPKTEIIRIGYIKTISAVYGLEYLLRAAVILNRLKLSHKFTLEIYGDGDDSEGMKELSNQLGISHLVNFHGRIPNSDVPAALNLIDIFCVPSESESFGVAAIEAMSCCVPCVTSDTPGLIEVMRNGETGFLFPRKSTEALADRISTLINDSQLRAQMGQTGRKHVLSHYRWTDNLKVIDKALLTLVNGFPID